MSDRDTLWLGERPRLLAIAYNILGSWADAEDTVSEAWLRLQSAPELIDARAWLTVIISRIALDTATSAARARTDYIGPWLPEIVVLDEPGPEERAVLQESVDLALVRMFQELTPTDRVILVLADVFDVPFRDIAEVLGSTPAATRQKASRPGETSPRPRLPEVPSPPPRISRVWPGPCRRRTSPSSPTCSPRAVSCGPTVVASPVPRADPSTAPTRSPASLPGSSAPSACRPSPSKRPSAGRSSAPNPSTRYAWSSLRSPTDRSPGCRSSRTRRRCIADDVVEAEDLVENPLVLERNVLDFPQVKEVLDRSRKKLINQSLPAGPQFIGALGTEHLRHSVLLHLFRNLSCVHSRSSGSMAESSAMMLRWSSPS